jgi:hypothetical protein
MKYATAIAFWDALNDYLKKRSPDPSKHEWIRKMVAFERFLARLAATQGTAWVLKRGLALQYSLRSGYRTTMDIDLLFQGETSFDFIHQRLVAAGEYNLGDYFRFEVSKSSTITVGRYPVICFVGGKEFTRFHIDVGVGDILIEPAEILDVPSYLEFAGISPVSIRTYPISQQIAEKVHACTLPHPSGESSRIKDWVDILMLAHMQSLLAETLQKAIEATFRVRDTHPLPTQFPPPSMKYKKAFMNLLMQIGLNHLSFDDALMILAKFLDPVLQKQAHGRWNPNKMEWE